MTLIEALKIAAERQVTFGRGRKLLRPEMASFALTKEEIFATDWKVDLAGEQQLLQNARLIGLIQQWIEEDEDGRP